MLRMCGDYVEDMLIFAQCSINILSNQHKGTSTRYPYAYANSQNNQSQCQMQAITTQFATVMIAKSWSKGPRGKSWEDRERERKCGRSFPINADKEIRRGGRELAPICTAGKSESAGVVHLEQPTLSGNSLAEIYAPHITWRSLDGGRRLELHGAGMSPRSKRSWNYKGRVISRMLIALISPSECLTWWIMYFK